MKRGVAKKGGAIRTMRAMRTTKAMRAMRNIRVIKKTVLYISLLMIDCNSTPG